MSISELSLKDARILIVDDEPANVRYLEVILQQAGYKNIQVTTDAREALPRFNEFQPDIVMLDLNMPHLDGFAVMEQMQAQIADDSYLPFLVLTADATSQVKRKALGAGAKDFIAKPLDATEVILRTNNLLQTRFQNVVLEQKVQARTVKLEEAQLETLQRLAIAAEYRDDDTGLHTRRVGVISGHLARCLDLPKHQVDLIEQTSPLHDVGKIGISDTILLKPGKLTEEEFATMKHHAAIGGKILSGSSSPWLQMAGEIALSHHERWNGKGYPGGLEGEAIPLVGRIVAVADVFDALTHERPYKRAWPIGEALAEIERQGGHQFDPRLTIAFLKLPHDELLS
ncbi:MAG TPA: HD domain-containing phosphohydrolase [Abditibacteriaceae bacterium]|jgi:putative two-component system response regulator